MKQLLQYIKTGQTLIADVPAPQAGPDRVLVQTANSLVSAGTERMVVDFAEKNLLQKAKARPDLVRQTVDKARREGILPTFEAVQNRLDQPMALGYSCAGTVLEVGANVPGLNVGDRVACAGGGYAAHAEIVSVPKNLVVKLPAETDFESAAFTTLGAIALQGVRLAEVKVGEVVAVIGLGLLGQLTVQLLKAAGCVVIGMDIQPERAELAQQFGINAIATTGSQLQAQVSILSNGYGADAVLITADTKSNEPVDLAGQISREKGIIVAVGAVGMNIPRKLYYEKELDFRVSRSYGPGRYDSKYEEQGQDYPYGYVRWTEQRNMQAFVQLIAEGKINLQPLITHRFPIDQAPKAYELITGKTAEPFLGVLLTYPAQPDPTRKIQHRAIPAVSIQAISDSNSAEVLNLNRIRLGVLGAGNFANATLLPAIKKVANIDLIGIASGQGVSARSAAEKFNFAYSVTDATEILNDDAVNTVAVLTRHHLHARQVITALQSNKHVFVEKPLCLTVEELEEIIDTYQTVQQFSRPPYLMVGFNRRFAPFIIELKRYLQQIQEPLMLHYRVNAGYIPPNHWVQDPTQGGGRLLGEGCHFIDLLIHLCGSAPHRITTCSLPDSGRYSQDNLLITLEFANGSLGTITYASNGDKSFSKEQLEVFGGGLSAQLDDYRTLVIQSGKQRIKRVARLRQDKGHQAEWVALTAWLTGQGPIPITFDEIVQSTTTTLAAQLSLRQNCPIILPK